MGTLDGLPQRAHADDLTATKLPILSETGTHPKSPRILTDTDHIALTAGDLPAALRQAEDFGVRRPACPWGRSEATP
ncbi:hypothetical protein ACRB68_75160 [Actinomadura sp. RB68]|uniref:Uncharacterized protein n=2 Tax=Actinomadura macrotermitis TaxID=2585200 RepID=A0A7K0C7F8_9ACTN|nr:hypothetical protein [Actinomadura macrotermitis]